MFETLSADLYKDVIGIKQAATWGVVLKAVADHTAAAKQKVFYSVFYSIFYSLCGDFNSTINLCS